MFFTMTAAIGGAMAAAAWSIQDGPTIVALAAGAAGLICATAAASLVVRLDRRVRAADPGAGEEPGPGQTADEWPRLPRRRAAGSCPPGRDRLSVRPDAARFASVP
ncbi:hypothetical protein DA075_31255 [Methylobacterium currus]|uniref:Uncharacterized protein n=1 Tax=Methylobacterium currus TaxID=2051553 RepID=A0A2R4WV12_9HYPH|nr:hypothetical protein [Methylobacterium currus]AWB25378.1 hypothetical protein DA075_31255 [Methylobacterium currus]